jgi:hypothetical protein
MSTACEAVAAVMRQGHITRLEKVRRAAGLKWTGDGEPGHRRASENQTEAKLFYFHLYNYIHYECPGHYCISRSLCNLLNALLANGSILTEQYRILHYCLFWQMVKVSLLHAFYCYV